MHLFLLSSQSHQISQVFVHLLPHCSIQSSTLNFGIRDVSYLPDIPNRLLLPLEWHLVLGYKLRKGKPVYCVSMLI
jgi:hypothetical protein